MEAPDEARAPKVAAESWLDRKAGPELESALPLLTGFPNRVPKKIFTVVKICSLNLKILEKIGQN